MDRVEPTFRYSALDASMRCLRKYQYQYIDKVPSGQPESADMNFGTAVHAGLNAILEGEDGLSVFNFYWQSEKNKERKYGAHDWAALEQLGQIFLTRFKSRHAKKFKPVAMEQKLISSLGAFTLEGTPDFIGEFEGVPSVVDFKTSYRPYPNTKIVHNPQLYIYAAMAAAKLQYMPEQLVYMVFCKSPEPRIQVIKRAITPQDIEEMLLTVRDQCAELQGRMRFPKNCANCVVGSYQCEYFGKCWPQTGVTND